MRIYQCNEIIFIVEESPEGGYEARSLNHTLFTEADTFEELKEMIHERYPVISKLRTDPVSSGSCQVKEKLMTV